MWQYNYTDELYHYSVPGMKWGHRKARKYATKASTSRKTANEYDKKSKMAKRKGEKEMAKMYADQAKEARQYAVKYDKKAKKQNQKIKEREKFYKRRIDINESRGIGEKIAMNIVGGPFANRTYNSLLANGTPKNVALYSTIATRIIGGPIGHLVVSANVARNRKAL